MLILLFDLSPPDLVDLGWRRPAGFVSDLTGFSPPHLITTNLLTEGGFILVGGNPGPVNPGGVVVREF